MVADVPSSSDHPADGPASPDQSTELAASYRAEADKNAERIPDEQRRPTLIWRLLSAWIERVETWLRSHGGPRLRRGIRVFWTVIALGGIALLVGPIINPPLTFDDITKSADLVTAHWIARDFDADYTITRDAHGRLDAHIEERIGALFPKGVNESGIERVIATDYEGHSLDPTRFRASLDGKPVAVGRSDSPTRSTITLDAGRRLTGDHLFVLDYDLHDLAYPSTDDATGKPVDLLRWDVFGPSWPQGFSALNVSITMPKQLDQQLVRQPRGELAWLILGSGEWLTPDHSAPGWVTYAFVSHQNIPPHANAGFTMNFNPDTFTLPPHDTLWWVQTFGPALPLAFLIVVLLLALAARAVAWGDAHGRPWYVVQFDPPDQVPPALAAQVLRTSAAVELAGTLVAAQNASKSGRRQLLLAVARAAQRVGRIGDRPRALVRFALAPERAAVLRAELRRVPRGFVRDSFIGAAIALTVVQWGLVRQLSYQVAFSIVWWPVAFVLVSSALAIVVLSIALSARPLTEKGALVRQHLLGVRQYVRQTNFFERATLTEKLLPYAVLLVPARQAGAKVAELVHQQLGNAYTTKGWRGGGYLTVPRLLIRILAPLSIVAAIVVVATVPAPSPASPEYLSYFGDLPGTLGWRVDTAHLAGKLTRTGQGRAHLAVTEKLGVTFDKDSGDVPQFVQQWPDRSDGQSLHLKVTAIAVDGADVPFRTQRDHDTTLAVTTMARPLAGKHTVTIRYALGSAAVADVTSAGTVDRVRWAALLDGWEDATGWGDPEHPIHPLTVSLTVPDSLATSAVKAGWLTDDGSTAFGTASSTLYENERLNESTTAADEATTHTLEPLAGKDSLYPLKLTADDLGAQLDFPAGTFTGPSVDTLQAYRFRALLPALSSIAVGAVALILAALGIVAGIRRRAWMFAAGARRDLVRALGPALGLSSVILFAWAATNLYGDEPQFLPLILVSLLSFVASIASLVLTRRSRGVAPAPRPKRS